MHDTHGDQSACSLELIKVQLQFVKSWGAKLGGELCLIYHNLVRPNSKSRRP